MSVFSSLSKGTVLGRAKWCISEIAQLPRSRTLEKFGPQGSLARIVNCKRVNSDFTSSSSPSVQSCPETDGQCNHEAETKEPSHRNSCHCASLMKVLLMLITTGSCQSYALQVVMGIILFKHLLRYTNLPQCSTASHVCVHERERVGSVWE